MASRLFPDDGRKGTKFNLWPKPGAGNGSADHLRPAAEITVVAKIDNFSFKCHARLGDWVDKPCHVMPTQPRIDVFGVRGIGARGFAGSPARLKVEIFMQCCDEFAANE